MHAVRQSEVNNADFQFHRMRCLRALQLYFMNLCQGGQFIWRERSRRARVLLTADKPLRGPQQLASNALFSCGRFAGINRLDQSAKRPDDVTGYPSGKQSGALMPYCGAQLGRNSTQAAFTRRRKPSPARCRECPAAAKCAARPANAACSPSRRWRRRGEASTQNRLSGFGQKGRKVRYAPHAGRSHNDAAKSLFHAFQCIRSEARDAYSRFRSHARLAKWPRHDVSR